MTSLRSAWASVRTSCRVLYSTAFGQFPQSGLRSRRTSRTSRSWTGVWNRSRRWVARHSRLYRLWLLRQARRRLAAR